MCKVSNFAHKSIFQIGEIKAYNAISRFDEDIVMEVRDKRVM